MLETSLPALEKAVRFTGRNHELMVVDNGSEDGSADWIRARHPGVRVIELEENLGFGEGNNRGVEAARHPVVVLINNDMIVFEDFLDPLLESFSDPSVFAVSSQIYFPEGKRREETGNTRGLFRNGWLNLSHEPLVNRHRTRDVLPVLWAGGGSSAFHRGRFLQLGGFSRLFSPCYVEDTDLSYGAWVRGWKVLLASRSRVLHKHRSSSRKRFQTTELTTMFEKRKLWYLWKNYQFRTLFSHLLLLPIHLNRHVTIETYLSSLLKLPAVLLSRWKAPRRVLTDETLFLWIGQPLHYFNYFYPKRRPAAGLSRPLHILVVSAYLPHLGQHGGAGRVFQLLKQVSRHHRISVISFVETDAEIEDTSQLEPYCARVETVRRGAFAPVSVFPYEPFEEFNTYAMRQRLADLLAEEDFDIVHFEWTQMAQYADLVADVPRLVTEIEVNYAAHHTRIGVETRPLQKVRRFYNTLQTLYREVALCRLVDKVVCVTEDDRDYLRGYLPPEKLAVINTGVDTAYFRPDASRTEAGTLVFVGAFRHDPNVDAMLYFCERILPLIRKERPETRLIIVGSSPPPALLDLRKHPGVTVTGFVEDIREYYHRAQVVVVPLRIGVGIRGKILEAWAAGKAVVATGLACQGIQAVHGTNVLMADEPELFAAWTLALLRHPEYCRKMGTAGRETAEKHYEWTQLGAQLASLYESMAAADPALHQPPYFSRQAPSPSGRALRPS